MDKLYYAVRKMDNSLIKTKKILDEIEHSIDAERGSTVQSRMVKYYLATAGSEVNAVCEEIEKNMKMNPLMKVTLMMKMYFPMIYNKVMMMTTISHKMKEMKQRKWKQKRKVTK